MSGKVEGPLVPRLSEVYPTNSQFVPLPMMGFKYVKGCHQSMWGPFSSCNVLIVIVFPLIS